MPSWRLGQSIAKSLHAVAATARSRGAPKFLAIEVSEAIAVVINGTERTFLDRYGDYFWFSLLLLSGIGSVGAWLRQYFNRDERDAAFDLVLELFNHATVERRTMLQQTKFVPAREAARALSDRLTETISP